MRIIPPNFNKVIIVGNGLDLNLGMKTSYYDFIHSRHFEELLLQKNPFAEALRNKLRTGRWIDAENELKYIANEYTQINSQTFKDLCKALMSYMSEIHVPENFKDSYAFKMLKEQCSSNFLLIDFNYTDSTSTILKELKLFVRDVNDLIVKVHGSVRENSIIFGIEDEAEVARVHLYLQKSYHKDFKGINLDQVWENVREIHLFGHSLGQTDHPYFANFFKSAAEGAYIQQQKKFFLYYYGDESYEDLMRQIDVMTNGNIRYLKQKIHFQLIDVK